MQHWSKYVIHEYEVEGKKNKIDTTIYSLDIETSSFLVLDDTVIPAINYLKLSKEEQEESIKMSHCYIWMLSINDNVYYGRKLDELRLFLEKIEKNSPFRKIIFIHNLSFEFQFLSGYFKMEEVLARKKRKVMRNYLDNFNIELRCTYLMSNSALAKLPSTFNLPIEKMEGDLDYSKVRTSVTTLTKKELKYCENDCLIIYHYIKKQLEIYISINKIPLTSTGHVRRELKSRVLSDYNYRCKVSKAINTDGYIYNLLVESFQGGYTHCNWLYTDEVLKNVKSWDFTSSYPYVMVAFKFPSTEFKKCRIRRREDMSKRFAYILKVKFKNVKCKYYNTFISASKCKNIKGARYDNGRIASAEEFEMTLTDIDFNFILDSHNLEYEIIESFYSIYNYLPKQFIEFILEKYVVKTEFKGVEGKEVEYALEKGKFNALFGMSVTNNIRDEVIYNEGDWIDRKISNEEILDKLNKEKKDCFLSFSWGVWITAHARNNLLRNILKLDEFVSYSDTDSIKLIEGYDHKIIEDYNLEVIKRLKYVSEVLDIDYEKFEPTDIKDIKRTLGIFDSDGDYLEFISQGAKKYAYKCLEKNKKTGKLEEKIHITVAGVPKKGAYALKDLNDFRDDFTFYHEDTNKNGLCYNDNQFKIEVEDYQGNKYMCYDKRGICVIPATYTLGKSDDYCSFLNDNSSARSIYYIERM